MSLDATLCFPLAAGPGRAIVPGSLMRAGPDTGMALGSISPKQPPFRQRRDWYPYYAGFTLKFVDAVIGRHMPDATFVLDPWSGSGTTTIACLQRGVGSRGIDINPALTVIARARLTPAASRGAIARALEDIVGLAGTDGIRRASPDLLESWFTPGAAARIRGLRRAIHTVLECCGETAGREDLGADLQPPLLSFFYCALFGVVRAGARRYRATNPMWLKHPQTPRHRARPSADFLAAELGRQVRYLANRLGLGDGPAGTPPASSFLTGNAASLPFGDRTFDGAVTSPPYATRIDYVQGTLPELAVLGADQAYVQRLRLASTGSPKVRGTDRVPETGLASRAARNLVRAIRMHGSKGSRSYYLPWMTNYLGGLQGGLWELGRAVRRGRPICVIVQDSYYKEVPVAMQRIVIETMSEVGRRLRARYDYPAPNPRRPLSPARNCPGRLPVSQETLLVFA